MFFILRSGYRLLKDFTQEKFDIIVQAGQSNSEGYGVGPTGHTYNPNDKVYFLNRDLLFLWRRKASEAMK